MEIKSIILFVITAISFVITGYIYGRNRKSHINLSFALLFFFAGLWSVGLGLFIISNNLDYAVVYAVLYYIAAILIAPTFYYFSLVYPFPSLKIDKRKIFLLYIPALILIILIVAPSVLINHAEKTDSGNIIILNEAYYLYVAVFLAYIINSFVILFKKLRTSEGVNKIQLQYISIGFIIGFSIGVTFNLILPLIGNYQLIWMGPYSAFFVLASILYLITKKH